MFTRNFMCADEIIMGLEKEIAAIYDDENLLKRDGYKISGRKDQYGWNVYELQDWKVDDDGRIVKAEHPYYIAQYKYALYIPK